MRKVILMLLTILLASAIWSSCRSSKQTAVERSDTLSVQSVQTLDKLASDDILSLINASREIDLSGISIEFWPPDSVHPDARAAPKSVRIEKANAKEANRQATHEQTEISEQGSRKLCAQRGFRQNEQSKSVNNSLSPPDWTVAVLIAAALIILFLIIYRKFRK